MTTLTGVLRKSSRKGLRPEGLRAGSRRVARVCRRGRLSDALSALGRRTAIRATRFSQAVQKSPAQLLKNLHSRTGRQSARRKATFPFRSHPWKNLRSAFSALIAWDSAKLVHVLRRVGVNGRNGTRLQNRPPAFPACMTFSAASWLKSFTSRRAGDTAPARIPGFLPNGSLSSSANAAGSPWRLMDQVLRSGADCVLELAGWGDFGACRVFEGTAEEFASRIEDVDVAMRLDGLHLPARRMRHFEGRQGRRGLDQRAGSKPPCLPRMRCSSHLAAVED